MYASKTTRGFYDAGIHGSGMPSDAVEISDEYYRELLNGQSAGLRIDWSGEVPILAEVVPNLEDMATVVRAKRNALLREIYDPAAHMLLRLQRTAPIEQQVAIAAKLAELDVYAEALQNIPEQLGFPTNIDWPQPPAKEL